MSKEIAEKIKGVVKMEKLEDLIYNITWRIKQIFYKITNKPSKFYSRTLTLKEIIKGG